MLSQFLTAFFIVDAIGLIVFACAFFRAKEGYQDEFGFHLGPAPIERAILSVSVQSTDDTSPRRSFQHSLRKRPTHFPKPELGFGAGAHS